MIVTAQRIGGAPIITPHMDARMGENVNGPALIEVPDWVPKPLARYYLYFGHHDGHYIRLAFADNLTGPWRTHEAGVLPLEESHFAGHIASPDVLIDHDARQIRLYYHGADVPTGSQAPQFTRVAVSTDGLNFSAREEILGKPYMRVIPFRDRYLAIAMPGIFYSSKDGLSDFLEGPNPFPAGMRHAALLKRDDQLFVFYSQIGDAPERILVSRIQLSDDWEEWRPEPPMDVVAPERDYEGGQLDVRPSVRGLAAQPVRELRDPAIFEAGGATYLLYSVAGESGIALARLTLTEA